MPYQPLQKLLVTLFLLQWGVVSQAFNVTIDQSASQADPTRNSLLLYTAVFASPVTGGSFACADVSLSGSATAQCFVISETAPMDGTTFQVAINGVSDGSVTVSIPAGGVMSGALLNNASTSSDGTVTLDTTPPVSAAILTSPSTIGNNLNAPIAGTCGSDAANGRVIAETTGGNGFLPQPATSVLDASGNFSIPVTWQEGSFSPRISCFDALDNGPTITVATTFPSSVTLDVTAPGVTINHTGGDPTRDGAIKFIAVMTEIINANSFTCADIDLSLSTVTSVTCSQIVALATPLPFGSYQIDLNASGSGVVVARILANRFVDQAGNGNSASTSTDNQVTFFDINPAVVISPSDGQVISGTFTDVVAIQLKDSNANAFCSASLGTGTWTCSPAAGMLPGDGEQITATGTDVLGGTVDVVATINGLATVPDKDRDGIPDRVELYSDTDSDGIDDYYDLDSDNDGIPDVVEAGDYKDSDGDKISDRFDVDVTEKFDSNGDGIDDAALFDQDNDGIADFRDVDSDGDGLPDRTEGGITQLDTDGDGIDNYFDVTQTGGSDSNGDGIDDAISAKNTDGRKLPDYYTRDSDDDGISDRLESNIILLSTDADMDGIDDAIDADADGNSVIDAGKTDADSDGVDDVVNVDTDGDGVFDRFDLDSDNDSLLDAAEAAVVDANNDGFIDDGQALVITPLNSDADTTPDYRDVDKQNDSVLDISLTSFSSADTNADGRADITADVDMDGIMLPIDTNPNVYGNLPSSTTPTPVPPGTPDKDSDGDLIPDSVEAALTGAQEVTAWLRDDADGDGIGDLIESGLSAANRDSDSDGIDDAFDSDADGDGNLDSGKQDADGNQVIDGLAGLIRNTDGDGLVDMLDTDSDGDGLLDQSEGRADFDGDGIEDYIDLDPPIQVASSGGAAVQGVSLFILFMLFLLRHFSWKKGALLVGMLSASTMLDASIVDRCLKTNEVSLFVGVSHLKPQSSGVFAPTENSSSGGKLQIACDVYPNIYAELFYSELGAINISHLNPALNINEDLSYQALGLSGRYRYGFQGDRVGIYGRLGLAQVKTDAGALVRVDEKSSPQAMVGLGVDWFLNERWSIDLAHDRYTDDAQLTMLGITYQLGNPKRLVQRPAEKESLLAEEHEPIEIVSTESKYNFPEIELYFDEDIVWEKPNPKRAEELIAKAPTLAEVQAVLADPFIPLTERQVAADSCDKYKVRGMDPALSIGFAVDNAGMTYEAMESLQHFAGCMSYHLDGTLIIEGHTDDTAAESYNLKLSSKRAAVVKDFLLRLGMSAKRISDVGRGEEDLKNKQKTELGHAHNRRVEVYIR